MITMQILWSEIGRHPKFSLTVSPFFISRISFFCTTDLFRIRKPFFLPFSGKHCSCSTATILKDLYFCILCISQRKAEIMAGVLSKTKNNCISHKSTQILTKSVFEWICFFVSFMNIKDNGLISRVDFRLAFISHTTTSPFQATAYKGGPGGRSPLAW